MSVSSLSSAQALFSQNTQKTQPTPQPSAAAKSSDSDHDGDHDVPGRVDRDKGSKIDIKA